MEESLFDDRQMICSPFAAASYARWRSCFTRRQRALRAAVRARWAVARAPAINAWLPHVRMALLLPHAVAGEQQYRQRPRNVRVSVRPYRRSAWRTPAARATPPNACGACPLSLPASLPLLLAWSSRSGYRLAFCRADKFHCSARAVARPSSARRASTTSTAAAAVDGIDAVVRHSPLAWRRHHYPSPASSVFHHSTPEHSARRSLSDIGTAARAHATLAAARHDKHYITCHLTDSSA